MSTEFTRESITLDLELTFENDGIAVFIETWFDVDEKFGLNTADNPEQCVNFYAIYHPEKGALRCVYVLHDGIQEDTEHEYNPTPNEAALIKAMMQEVCCIKHSCGLLGLWREHGADNEQLPKIRFDGSIYRGEEGIDTLVEPWFDAAEKLPFPIPQDPDTSSVFFYALYNPDDCSMKYICRVEYDEGDMPECIHEFELTEPEIALLKDGMEALCQKENQCGLETFGKMNGTGECI